MSILDELEAHATHATRMQNASQRVQMNLTYFRALEKRIPLYKTLAVIGALVPFVGWWILSTIYLIVFSATQKGDKKEAAGHAAGFGVFVGIVSFGITYATGAMGFNNAETVEMLILYTGAVFFAYSTFSECKKIIKIRENLEIVDEHIDNQA